MQEISKLAELYESETIQHRRWLHQHAELAWKEFETSSYIEEQLCKLGLKPQHIENSTGCYVTICGDNVPENSKTILLRADIDAMGGQDTKSVPYASIHDGSVHMCGHDAHTAMLLTAAKILLHKKQELKGNVRLVFQPAEEFGYGAKYYVEHGITDHVDAAYSIHLWGDTDAGRIGIINGPAFAGGITFTITIHGKPHHTGAPHQCHDPIMAAAKIIENLQLVETRRNNPFNPLVLAIGKIYGGDIPNAYAGETTLEGTIRTFSREFQKESIDIVKDLVTTSASLTGCTADINFSPIMPPLLHESETFTQLVRNSAITLYGNDFIQLTDKTMGSDDFAYFLEKVPGVYALLGVRDNKPEHQYPLHDCRFDFDESVLKRGTAMYAQVAIDYLNS